jgi:MFS family permease
MRENYADIASRVVKALKLFEYSAVSLLLLTLLAHFLRISISSTVAVVGVVLVVVTPAAGVVVTGWLSLRSGRRALFYISLLIIAIFMIALWVSR